MQIKKNFCAKKIRVINKSNLINTDINEINIKSFKKNNILIINN